MVLRNALSVVMVIGFSRLREATIAVATMMITIAAPTRRKSFFREGFHDMNGLHRERLFVRILLVFVLLTLSCRRQAEPPAPERPPAPESSGVSGPKLLPVDDGTRDPSFAKFREQLLDVVRRRDVPVPEVVTRRSSSFGPEGVIADFGDIGSRLPTSSLVRLEFILTHAANQSEQFWPRVYSAWP